MRWEQGWGLTTHSLTTSPSITLPGRDQLARAASLSCHLPTQRLGDAWVCTECWEPHPRSSHSCPGALCQASTVKGSFLEEASCTLTCPGTRLLKMQSLLDPKPQPAIANGRLWEGDPQPSGPHGCLPRNRTVLPGCGAGPQRAPREVLC